MEGLSPRIIPAEAPPGGRFSGASTAAMRRPTGGWAETSYSLFAVPAEYAPAPFACCGTSASAGRFLPMGMKRAFLLSCVLTAASSVASAQAPPGPLTPPARTAPPSPDRAANCAPVQSSPRSGTTAPEGTTTGQRAEPLGDKLARSDGVVCPPPGVDPEMHAPTPDTGSKTPVIPPPGSPGGDPTIRPK